MTALEALCAERDSLLRRIKAKRPGVAVLRARLKVVTTAIMREGQGK